LLKVTSASLQSMSALWWALCLSPSLVKCGTARFLSMGLQ
jgi:hypothetical protein